MFYLSARETAEKWGVNVSLVKRYCAQGRIPGVVFKDHVWRIPEDALRPSRTVSEYSMDRSCRNWPKSRKIRRKSGIFMV